VEVLTQKWSDAAAGFLLFQEILPPKPQWLPWATLHMVHQYKLRKTAAIADLSYLTYLPLPLSTS